MPVEFPCQQCGQTLRTPESTRGQQARCPACGGLTTVPLASDTAASQETSPASQSPFAAPAQDSDNPYLAPQTSGGYTPDWAASGPLPRTGPPWERDGPSFRSFLDTVTEGFTQPNLFFATMRPDGSIGAPLAFLALGALAGYSVMTLLQAIMQGLSLALVDPNTAWLGLLAFVGILVAGLFFGVVSAVIMAFINGGMYHGLLLLTKGAQWTFLGTFRAVAYASGFTMLVMAIPCCGAYLWGIVYLVYMVIGLMRMHDAPAWKALVAVLTPMVICCGAVILFYGAIIAAVIASDPSAF